MPRTWRAAPDKRNPWRRCTATWLSRIRTSRIGSGRRISRSRRTTSIRTHHPRAASTTACHAASRFSNCTIATPPKPNTAPHLTCRRSPSGRAIAASRSVSWRFSTGRSTGTGRRRCLSTPRPSNSPPRPRRPRSNQTGGTTAATCFAIPATTSTPMPTIAARSRFSTMADSSGRPSTSGRTAARSCA